MKKYFLHEILGGECEAIKEKISVKYTGLKVERRDSVAVIIVDFL